MNTKITRILFLVIDRNFYLLNKSNKDILEKNASSISTLDTNAYISEKSFASLKSIVRSKLKIKENETLITKFISKADICSAERIKYIDNMLAELEADIQTDSNAKLEQTLKKMNYINLN